jgi:hypothetical protein
MNVTVECTRKVRNAYEILAKNLKRKDHLGAKGIESKS